MLVTLHQMSTNYHIVVAAGTGSRFGGRLPKQFCEVAGRPMLMHTLENLFKAYPDAVRIVVLHPDWVNYWRDLCLNYGFHLAHRIVDGGATRAESVRNALRLVDRAEVGWISVHDAARPAVTPELFEGILAGLDGADGAIPVIDVTDSLRRVSPDGGSVAVDRSLYRAVQTPQIFDGRKLLDANLGELRPEFTDDASVMEAAGYGNLRLVPGAVYNIKVTTSGDMSRMEQILASMS